MEPVNPNKFRFRAPIVFSVLIVGTISALLAYAMVHKHGVGGFSFRKPPEPMVIVTTDTVKPNDSLAAVLKRCGLASPYVFNVEKIFAPRFKERSLQPGQNFKVITSTDGLLQSVIYFPDQINSFTVNRSTDGAYTVAASSKTTVWVEKRLTFDIKDFLYKDLHDMGYSENFVANIVDNLGDNLFGSRVDFFTEQRPGDHVDVLYEENFIVGENKRTGNMRILYAAYIGKATRTKENYAFRYILPGENSQVGYYDEKGEGVKRAFLRAPFTHAGFHVSSRFSSSRFHPILRVYRPHHGIDYAASYGTHVAAIGNGRVIYAGWKGGFGNCVEIRHNAKFVSRYGHLSHIAMHVGQNVGQGQWVGNVGNTGLSTGPHLHFEVLVNGEKSNFLKMGLPPAPPLPSQYLADFNQMKAKTLAHLNSFSTQPVPQVKK